VTKCLAAPKPKTKELAKSIILMFCEIEQYEKVIEELIKGLAQKNPKTISGKRFLNNHIIFWVQKISLDSCFRVYNVYD